MVRWHCANRASACASRSDFQRGRNTFRTAFARRNRSGRGGRRSSAQPGPWKWCRPLGPEGSPILPSVGINDFDLSKLGKNLLKKRGGNPLLIDNFLHTKEFLAHLMGDSQKSAPGGSIRHAWIVSLSTTQVRQIWRGVDEFRQHEFSSVTAQRERGGAHDDTSVARPAGFEPATIGLEDRCSIP